MLNEKRKLKFYPFFVVAKFIPGPGGRRDMEPGLLIPCKTREEAEDHVDRIFSQKPWNKYANDSNVWIAEAVIDQDGDLVFGEDGAHGEPPMLG